MTPIPKYAARVEELKKACLERFHASLRGLIELTLPLDELQHQVQHLAQQLIERNALRVAEFLRKEGDKVLAQTVERFQELRLPMTSGDLEGAAKKLVREALRDFKDRVKEHEVTADEEARVAQSLGEKESKRILENTQLIQKLFERSLADAVTLFQSCYAIDSPPQTEAALHQTLDQLSCSFPTHLVCLIAAATADAEPVPLASLRALLVPFLLRAFPERITAICSLL